ncbi:hypothetical protein YPPY08_3172, partial [Yersinia pestis PY-08]
MFISTDKAVA